MLNQSWLARYQLEPAPYRWDLDKAELWSFGVTHDLPLLTMPEWPGGRAEGLEMLAVAGRIQDASGGFIDTAGDLILFFTLHRFRMRSQ
jgi:hypothetical protein